MIRKSIARHGNVRFIHRNAHRTFQRFRFCGRQIINWNDVLTRLTSEDIHPKLTQIRGIVHWASRPLWLLCLVSTIIRIVCVICCVTILTIIGLIGCIVSFIDCFVCSIVRIITSIFVDWRRAVNLDCCHL